MTTKPKRRRFQFSLRTLLVAVLVLSLPLSWFAVRLEKARRQREAVKAIRSLGGDVVRDYQHDDYNPFLLRDQLPWRWGREVLGDDFFSSVTGVVFCGEFSSGRKLTDDDVPQLVARINALPKCRRLFVSKNPNLSDSGLAYMQTLTSMETIYLSDTKVTEEGVQRLAEALPNTMVSASWGKRMIGHLPNRSSAK